ncbi:chromosome segregation protein SMC [Endozoicomonas sp. G2_1]|uniref:chromosome segregation protein SMC n=1 Tax=Endozoicomonas sp. G2_1 TaxID=2821091 RepID=UPI0024688762|nr:chromosome segregation protein SMC [Endozoicomonas sp. G2_1]
MRLKQIKLAGFKSFVDSTKVPFTEQMTAIVGPNGCGKSNIIDAVRWVLGESSAKNLRGDAMTDVIFNGATSRKPVGQASVELVFENVAGHLQGTMAGEIAERNEVAVRRLVTRDGNNSYFLNGSKCRRKDITDIFLGTGLGPRSYAIIEQGTVSRLIESKPQELRVFIEEAAGISKYKERRRDTENRIRHTRENLERLTDIRLELGAQIEKLHKQSEAAKRFKTLKQSERKYKAELSVLRWQQFNQKSQAQQDKMSALQQQVQDLVLAQNTLDAKLFEAKQTLEVGGESIGDLQQQKIVLTNDIARLEQSIKHNKQQQIITSQTLAKAEQTLKRSADQQQLDQQALVEVELLAAEQAEALLIVEQQLVEQQALLVDAQNRQQSAQQQLNQANKSAATDAEHKANLSQKINYNQKTVTELAGQLEQLKVQLDHDSNSQQAQQEQQQDLAIALEDNLKQQAQLAEQVELVSAEHQQIQELVEQVKQQRQQVLAQQQAEQALLAQLQSLLAPKQDWLCQQQDALSGNDQNSDCRQLYQILTVEPGWEACVELVLAQWLQAQLVDDLSPLEFEQQLMLIAPEQSESVSGLIAEPIPGSLAEKVSGHSALNQWLNQIIVADDLSHAQQLVAELDLEQSVICREGYWLSQRFIRRGRIGSSDSSDNVLQHQQQQQALQQSLERLAENVLKGNQQLTELTAQEERVSQQLAQITGQQRDIAQQGQQLKQQLALVTQSADIAQRRQQELQQNYRDLEQSYQEQQELQAVYQLELEEFEQGYQAVDLSELERTSASANEQSRQLQQQIEQLHQSRHQQSLALEYSKSKQQSLQQSLARIALDCQTSAENIAELTERLEALVMPIDDDEQQLQVWLKQMAEVDDKLSFIQQNLAGDQQRIKQLEQEKQAAEQSVNQLKEQINQHHLDAESFRVRANAALESLAEMQQNVNQVLAQMPENAQENIWQGHLVKLAKEISRLGPINLAAIDEYDTQLERKNFLDQQDQDLSEAISTLEAAIAKIDRETKHKFKLTFDQINQDLQQLFPKVFGGGQAYLALTGDDMLDTGVTIMARPPGKKNSTIHLLSGGEKALTALSLVFAIFRLNPAPFCMLDEVDAPLDDANVGRFCNLVREMSQTVQFIYISHNKIAMEMASHLTGVTMFEPGVSRMVAVDIDEAMAMAELG